LLKSGEVQQCEALVVASTLQRQSDEGSRAYTIYIVLAKMTAEFGADACGVESCRMGRR